MLVTTDKGPFRSRYAKYKAVTHSTLNAVWMRMFAGQRVDSIWKKKTII